jgi:hypothetical protein
MHGERGSGWKLWTTDPPPSINKIRQTLLFRSDTRPTKEEARALLAHREGDIVHCPHKVSEEEGVDYYDDNDDDYDGEGEHALKALSSVRAKPKNDGGIFHCGGLFHCGGD